MFKSVALGVLALACAVMAALQVVSIHDANAFVERARARATEIGERFNTADLGQREAPEIAAFAQSDLVEMTLVTATDRRARQLDQHALRQIADDIEDEESRAQTHAMVAMGFAGGFVVFVALLVTRRRRSALTPAAA